MDNTNKKIIKGFSRLTKDDKIRWVTETFFANSESTSRSLKQFWLDDPETQKILDGFSENTLTNFPMPFGVAPNFLINDRHYCIPMVIEESSVVAAASSGAKFWLNRGGFHFEIIDVEKLGHIHFFWEGEPKRMEHIFQNILKKEITDHISPFVKNMENRGGGVRKMELVDLTDQMDHYFQLKMSFDTCDSMGANFINTVLEECLKKMKHLFKNSDELKGESQPDFLMAILSNYTPDCLVKAWVKCPLHSLENASPNLTATQFADRFQKAVKIAEIDRYRAVTHNKGIFNGIDAVVIASGNDFRAVEACGHAFATKDGYYGSLTHCTIENEEFEFSLEIPLALGTVGGLTCLHPMAKHSLEMLGNPNARNLMGIAASTGLAQNFAAIRSLITTGIQYGHMKMHLENILNHLKATAQESELATRHFENNAISFNAVRNFIEEVRCWESRSNKQ